MNDSRSLPEKPYGSINWLPNTKLNVTSSTMKQTLWASKVIIDKTKRLRVTLSHYRPISSIAVDHLIAA